MITREDILVTFKITLISVLRATDSQGKLPEQRALLCPKVSLQDTGETGLWNSLSALTPAGTSHLPLRHSLQNIKTLLFRSRGKQMSQHTVDSMTSEGSPFKSLKSQINITGKNTDRLNVRGEQLWGRHKPTPAETHWSLTTGSHSPVCRGW